MFGYDAPVKMLGVDPGSVRMGLAWADDATGVAVPDTVVAYEGITRAAELICQLLREREAALVVLGLPTGADGAETPACRRTHRLAEALRDRGCRVELQPEYLTTNEARRRARLAGRPRHRPVDDLAAQIMLEEYLSELGCAGS